MLWLKSQNAQLCRSGQRDCEADVRFRCYTIQYKRAQYNIPRSTVTKILKIKEEITNLVHDEHKLSVKRIRCVTDAVIDEALYERFKQNSIQSTDIRTDPNRESQTNRFS